MAVMMLNAFMKTQKNTSVKADWTGQKTQSPLEKLYRLKHKTLNVEG
jgi:hypothetical protein